MHWEQDGHLVAEAIRMPGTHGRRQASLYHIIATVLRLQNKKITMKATGERHRVTNKSKLIRIAVSSAQALQVKRTGDYILQALREQHCQPRQLYQQSLSSKSKGKNPFHDKHSVNK